MTTPSMKIKYRIGHFLERIFRGEIWMEFGYLGKDGWKDMCWYNEGNWWEFPYFFKQYLTYKKGGYAKFHKMYFEFRLGKLKTFNLVKQ